MVYGSLLMLCHPCNFALSKGFFRAQRKTVAGSLAIATWLIAISFFVFFYEATLRATLMAIQYQSPINTVQGKFNNINENDSTKLFFRIFGQGDSFDNSEQKYVYQKQHGLCYQSVVQTNLGIG